MDRKTGAPAPKGLKTIGRWHAAGSSRGFHLVEGSEAALAEINAGWADLLELEVVPVVEDDVAGAVSKKVYGKKSPTREDLNLRTVGRIETRAGRPRLAASRHSPPLPYVAPMTG
jgi:hypothetical protein